MTGLPMHLEGRTPQINSVYCIANGIIPCRSMNDFLQDVERGDLASVQARIGADRSLLNARRADWPYTVLACAVYHGHLHIARYLVGEGAQVNEGDGSGSPALREACLRGHQAMVELLLEAGADAVTPDEPGYTPLMCAAGGSHFGTTRALLAHGCGDIDARDRDGWTALYWACMNGRTNAVLLLLEAGADTRIAEGQGRTPLERARGSGQNDCVAVVEVSTHTRCMIQFHEAFNGRTWAHISSR
jgi:ankyrin repeat protein